jgi:hypothetical protein
MKAGDPSPSRGRGKRLARAAQSYARRPDRCCSQALGRPCILRTRTGRCFERGSAQRPCVISRVRRALASPACVVVAARRPSVSGAVRPSSSASFSFSRSPEAPPAPAPSPSFTAYSARAIPKSRVNRPARREVTRDREQNFVCRLPFRVAAPPTRAVRADTVEWSPPR